MSDAQVMVLPSFAKAMDDWYKIDFLSRPSRVRQASGYRGMLCPNQYCRIGRHISEYPGNLPLLNEIPVAANDHSPVIWLYGLLNMRSWMSLR